MPTTITPVEDCFTAAPTGLYADPTNVFSFTAHWTEVPSCFGYRLDIATAPGFQAADYVEGYSNRAVSGTFQQVTGLTHNTLYYFRARAEWDALCTSANSSNHTMMIRNAISPSVIRPSRRAWFDSLCFQRRRG